MEPLPLKKIHTNVLFQLLNKLPNIQLCRMRQTSKFLDSFVEENQKALASRSIPGTDLQFEILKTEGKSRVLMNTKNNPRQVDMAAFDLPKQMSAICIHHIQIRNGFRSKVDAADQALEVFQKLPVFDNGSLWLNAELMYHLSETLNARTALELNWISQATDENQTLFLETMNQSSKKNSLSVDIVELVDGLEAKGLFDLVKEFKEMDFRAKQFDVFTVLKETFSAKDSGNIKRLSFKFKDKYWTGIPTFPGVSFTRLWDARKFPTIISSKILKWQAKFVPWTISIFKVNGKYILTTESERYHTFEITMVFLENLEEVWPLVFKQLTVRLSPKEFCDPENEQQIELFTATFKAQVEEYNEEAGSTSMEEDSDENSDSGSSISTDSDFDSDSSDFSDF